MNLENLDQELTRNEFMTRLAGASIESRQLYASSCLRQYCEFKNILHPAITALLDHLDAIATCKSVAEWNHEGALLELSGRGDSIPKSLQSLVSVDDLSEFSALVDSVVEVGLVDLYGAQTNLPLKFLNKALQVLEKNSIPFPELVV
jgi:hypothetical protein